MAKGGAAFKTSHRIAVPPAGHVELGLAVAANRPRVRESHLWNNNHVDENYEASFLDRLEALVRP